jgi:hypothetical protein
MTACGYGWWRLTNALWDNEKPLIAAVNGPSFAQPRDGEDSAGPLD